MHDAYILKRFISVESSYLAALKEIMEFIF